MDGENGKQTGGNQPVPEISKQITGGSSAGSEQTSGSGNPKTTGGTSTGSTGGSATGSGKEIGNQKIPGLPGITEVKAPAKKGSSANKSGANKELKEQISLLLVGGFGLAGSRFGEHWNISVEEADKISDPAVKILDRLGASEALGKYGDYIALFMAVGMVVAPRVIVTKALMEQSAKREVTIDVKPEQSTKGKSTGKQKGQVNPGTAANVVGSGTSNGGSTKALLNDLDQ